MFFRIPSAIKAFCCWAITLLSLLMLPWLCVVFISGMASVHAPLDMIHKMEGEKVLRDY